MQKIDNAQTWRPRPGATRGEWWRFSLYEIQDGCLRPAPDAQPEWYDPWPEFQGTRALTVGQAPAATQPAYQSLAKLVHQLKYHAGHKRYPDCLTEQSQNDILEWCQQHGLLGVLLSRWEAISLAPWRNSSGDWVQLRYSRGFGQVIQQREISGDAQDNKPSVLIHRLNDLSLVEEPPQKTWSRFFPTVEFAERNSFPYPAPYTDDFCRLYGERLMDFCNAAKLITGAMTHLGRRVADSKGGPDLARQQALDTINLLRRPVVSVLDLEDDQTVGARREAPSLLASFADMFAQDLAYGHAMLQCTCCGVAFVSSAYQAQYCSVNCRLRGQKRRLRAQMKKAKALHAEGQEPHQIAAAVGQPVSIVDGWFAKR